MVLTYLMNNNLQELIISVKTRLATKYFDKSAANHLFFTNNGKIRQKNALAFNRNSRNEAQKIPPKIRRDTLKPMRDYFTIIAVNSASLTVCPSTLVSPLKTKTLRRSLIFSTCIFS